MKAEVLAYFIGMLRAPKCAQAHLRLCYELPSDCIVCSLIIEAIERSWWSGRVQ